MAESEKILLKSEISMDIDHIKRLRQRNVQQQNVLTRHEIKQHSIAFVTGSLPPGIIRFLADRGYTSSNAALLQLKDHSYYPQPEYEGLIIYREGQLYAFSLGLSKDGTEVLTVLGWEDVTSAYEVNTHQRGIGKTFACLAREVLQEQLAQSR